VPEGTAPQAAVPAPSSARKRGGHDPDRALLQDWLADLQEGIEPEKIVARRGLARTFERWHMFEEATTLLLANVRAGACDADTLVWLARLYRTRGDTVRAAVMTDLASLRGDARSRTPGSSSVVDSFPATRLWPTLLALVLALLVGTGLGYPSGGSLLGQGAFTSDRREDAESMPWTMRDRLPGRSSDDMAREVLARANTGSSGLRASEVGPVGDSLSLPDREQTRQGVGDARTELFLLAGGDYRVTWDAQKQPDERACTFVAALQSKPGSSPIVFRTLGPSKTILEGRAIGGMTMVTGLPRGGYRITGAGTTCNWSVTITPAEQ